MTKVTERQQEREQAREHILKLVEPGDTLYTVLNHVSRSGMYRCISVYCLVEGEPYWLNGWADTLLEWGRDRKHADGLKCGGCGMDMGFHLVYSLATALWPNGFDCTGTERCPANDHVNARREYCCICGADLKDGEIRYTRKNWGYDWPVCSQACAAATWHHRHGGYAIKHKWL